MYLEINFSQSGSTYYILHMEITKSLLITFFSVLGIDSCTISIPTNDSFGGVQLISSGICGKHGLCISKPGGQFDCSCSIGYTGAFCHKSKYS